MIHPGYLVGRLMEPVLRKSKSKFTKDTSTPVNHNAIKQITRFKYENGKTSLRKPLQLIIFCACVVNWFESSAFDSIVSFHVQSSCFFVINLWVAAVVFTFVFLRFVLRNYIAQNAVEAAENDDFSKVCYLRKQSWKTQMATSLPCGIERGLKRALI